MCYRFNPAGDWSSEIPDGQLKYNTIIFTAVLLKNTLAETTPLYLRQHTELEKILFFLFLKDLKPPLRFLKAAH